MGEEENCRRSLEEVLGALMEVSAGPYVTHLLAETGRRMNEWMQTKENATLALFLACDLLQHIKEASQPLWNSMWPAIFGALTNKDAELRIPAAYAINLAASIPAFAELAGKAAENLAMILSAPAPKKRREDKAKLALDNAVAAMLQLALHHLTSCPSNAYAMIVAKLPLKEDEEEAKKVHKIIVQQMLSQNPGLLGANNAHLGELLKILAEVHKQENISEKETDEGIAQVFKGLPRELLMQHASSFSEKQQKKIERIVMS